MAFHLDTDFLIHAISRRGPERKRLWELAESRVEVQISGVAWYEYSRGPRPADLLAVARSFFQEDGILPFTEPLAARAAEVFRSLGSPRSRAGDIAIGITAVSRRATLLTRNARDFDGIPGLQIETLTEGP